MKATGVVRKVDELGRIVLPVELRRNLGIEVRDPLEIFVDGESIILKPYRPSCIFCGETSNIKQVEGKNICAECAKKLVKEFEI